MDEDVKKVIKMVEEGKLKAEEGARLIETIKEKEGRDESKGKFLRINIEDGSEKVNIKFPLKLVSWLGRFIPKEKDIIQVNGKGINLPIEEILKTLEGSPEEIVSLETEEGAFVKVWIE